MDNDLENVARKRVQARSSLVVHASMYAVMNLGFVVIWLLTGHGYPWFLWPTLGWGIGLLAHAITLAIGPGSEAERRAIEKEVHRQRELGHR